MDETPGIDELLRCVQLQSEDSIDELAKHWAIQLDQEDLQKKGVTKLEVIFKKWIEDDGTAVNGTDTLPVAAHTRGKVIHALKEIGEVEIAESYFEEIESVQKVKDEFSSLYTNVQEENVMVETCVMQCMPLGPPRVGKTCLKKRLLNEELQPDTVTPRTGVVEEKQTVLVNAPSTFTLKNWKPIPWETELLYLVQKFKKTPQILHDSIQSVSNKQGHLVTLLSLSIPMAFLSIFNILSFTHYVLVPFTHKLFVVFAMLSLLQIVLLSISHYHFTALGLPLLRLLTKGTQTVLWIKLSLHLYCLLNWAWPYYCIHTAFLILVVLVREIDQRLKPSKFFKWIISISMGLLGFGFGLTSVEIGESIEFNANAYQFLLAGSILLYYEISCIFGPLKVLGRHKLHTHVSMGFRVLILLITIPVALTSDLETYHMIAFITVMLLGNCLVYIILSQFFSKFVQLTLKITWVVSCFLLLYYYSSCYNMVFVQFQDLWTLIMFLSVNNSQRIINPDDYNEASCKIIKKAVKKLSDISLVHDQDQTESLQIYFTDAGGQPEFQEVLPSLLAGPTVFFLVFNLSKGFSKKYKVRYVDKNNDTKFQYKTQFTVMDALLQCLASISCLERFSDTQPGKKTGAIKPRVFFIGTHKDLVDNDDIVTMEKELKSSIENTTWYKTNIIQFASEDCLIHAVDNFDKSDFSFNQVRIAIEKLSTSDDYKVKLPASWFGLEMALRSLEEGVISVSKCQDIAEEYSNITSRKNLDEALWFLHNRVGSIRYYKQIPELRNIVITKPQVLFTIITNLLVQTYVVSKFREKGCFTKKDVNELTHNNADGFTPNQIIALLSYLHILAPLKSDSEGNREYFLPCTLSHAPKPDQTQLQSKGKVTSPALLIGFKCGYTPKGIFSGLISYMVQNKHFGLEWSLDKSFLFRDQATFIIGDTGYSLTMTSFPKYLQFEFREPHGEKLESAKTIKNSIQTSLQKGLGIVQQRLNYTYIDIKFGFYCSHSACINDHQAHPAFLMGNNMNILACSKQESNAIQVNDEQSTWFLKRSPINVLEVTRPKIVHAISFIGRHKKVTVAILLALFAFAFHGKSEFDLHAPQKGQMYIKLYQWSQYHILCQKHPRSVSCELEKMFNASWKQLVPDPFRPIRLHMNASYDFEDLKNDCSSLALITLFDNRFPEECSKPMRQIQNSFVRYLHKCSLSNDICWPLIHHFTGVEMPEFLCSSIGGLLGTDLTHFKIFSKFSGVLYLYYSVTYWYQGYNQCTQHLNTAIDQQQLKIEQLLDIIKFVMHTKPELAPAIILQNINHAFNTEMENIIQQLSEVTLSVNWQIPIITTANDDDWFESTVLTTTNKPVENYFPIPVRLD